MCMYFCTLKLHILVHSHWVEFKFEFRDWKEKENNIIFKFHQSFHQYSMCFNFLFQFEPFQNTNAPRPLTYICTNCWILSWGQKPIRMAWPYVRHSWCCVCYWSILIWASHPVSTVHCGLKKLFSYHFHYFFCTTNTILLRYVTLYDGRLFTHSLAS